MRKLILFSFAILCFACSKVQCQNTDGLFQNIIDSLDRVSPVNMPNVKPLGMAYVIKVRNQDQFDKVETRIIEAIKAGRKNLVVKISGGTFKFRENHISLDNLVLEDVSITIKGRNSVITSDDGSSNNIYHITHKGDLIMADSLIEVVNDKEKLCKIPFLNAMAASDVTFCKEVQITQWYKAPVYQVNRIDQSGIYFIAPELEYKNQFGRSGYNVNYDYMYADKTPRFRLYDKRKERPCTASCFLRISNSALKCVTIQNISFKGNKEGSSLITMSSVKASKVLVRKCNFDYIRSRVASFSGTDNVLFDNNVITNTAGNELFFNGGSNNVRVTNNQFKDCGLAIANTFCVTCKECSYYVANNTFCDFGYAAIGVGVWHGSTKESPSRGIIEHNEFYFTTSYFANALKYTLMDSGAIYMWTQNDEVVIRYNFIHDYVGAGSNRGIFCDDGACNLKIYSNVILNIPNSYCIDSRKSNDQHKGLTNNANNFMAHNVMDGRMRFQGYGEEERHCVKGANYFVKGDNVIENQYDGLEVSQKDVVITRLQEIKDSKLSKMIKGFKISGGSY